MTPETAYWLLSTIAQVSAALVGLVIVATVFVLAELRRTISRSDDVREYSMRIGRIAGSPSSFIGLIAVMAIIAVFLGVMTSLQAVVVLRDIDEVLADGVITRIDETSTSFTIFMTVTMVFAAVCTMVGYAAAGREASMFEDKHGGRKSVKSFLKQLRKEEQLREKNEANARRANRGRRSAAVRCAQDDEEEHSPEMVANEEDEV